MKLGILTSHPIQYQAPLFREIAGRRGASLRVFFCHDHGVKPTFDPGFGKVIAFDVPLLDGYDHEFMPNVSPRPKLGGAGLINPRIIEVVARGEVDALVVHGYASGTSLLALLTAPRAARILMRGDSNALARLPLWKRAAKQAALRGLFQRVDVFLTSGALNAAYYERYGAPRSKLVLAPFSVDNDYFIERSAGARRDPNAARRALGLPEGGPLFVFAGKLVGWKRPLDAVRAFAKARARGPACLAMIGEGELRGALAAEVERLALGGEVRLLGFRNQSDLPAIYGAADALILPSATEPWGLAVNEAMACGAAAVVSDQVGCGPDLVAPERVFRCGDVEALASIMARMIDEPGWLLEARRASAARIAAWGVRQTADGFLAGAELAVEQARSRRAR